MLEGCSSCLKTCLESGLLVYNSTLGMYNELKNSDIYAELTCSSAQFYLSKISKNSKNLILKIGFSHIEALHHTKVSVKFAHHLIRELSKFCQFYIQKIEKCKKEKRKKQFTGEDKESLSE
jgi:hypothetical protein